MCYSVRICTIYYLTYYLIVLFTLIPSINMSILVIRVFNYKYTLKEPLSFFQLSIFFLLHIISSLYFFFYIFSALHIFLELFFKRKVLRNATWNYRIFQENKNSLQVNLLKNLCITLFKPKPGLVLLYFLLWQSAIISTLL